MKTPDSKSSVYGYEKGSAVKNPAPESQVNASIIKNHSLQHADYKGITGGKTTDTGFKKNK
jgi:hypothetical protein